ncbi:sulfurtransferase TusA family protein [Thermotoga sp. SG1]|uniref:sulfurtransferase TusA family protein n=1 Tax=Thermotoga sp. SG1 TaxID=126739 RepID=UPI000C784910|nr:sulfurtransferase TusA family protein [Thermotoga sp. SG1]PLV56292.1 hypothetical protein AS006_06960 [Thermotoga sp. SG1]
MEKFSPTRTLDLRGVRCPVNFVKAQVTLEEMEDGDILEILLDEGEPLRNVPRSLKDEGHEILRVENLGDYYRLFVRKNSPKKEG